MNNLQGYSPNDLTLMIQNDINNNALFVDYNFLDFSFKK